MSCATIAHMAHALLSLLLVVVLHCLIQLVRHRPLSFWRSCGLVLGLIPNVHAICHWYPFWPECFSCLIWVVLMEGFHKHNFKANMNTIHCIRLWLIVHDFLWRRYLWISLLGSVLLDIEAFWAGGCSQLEDVELLQANQNCQNDVGSHWMSLILVEITSIFLGRKGEDTIVERLTSEIRSLLVWPFLFYLQPFLAFNLFRPLLNHYPKHFMNM
jgi:hypothetical protein